LEEKRICITNSPESKKMDKNIVLYTTKQIAKKVLRYTYKVDAKEDKSIVIFSTRRSGSTLLKEMIYSQPQFDYVNEPFKFWRPNKFEKHLPEREGNRYKKASKNGVKKIANLHRKIIKGDVKFRSQWNVLDEHFSIDVRRIVFKEFNTKPVAHELRKILKTGMIYLVRHPVGSVRSIMDRGWEDELDVFVDRNYLTEYLDEAAISFCESVCASGGQFARHVLQWCLENLCLLRRQHDQGIFLLTYEELVSRPERISHWLSDEFDLPRPSRMVECVGRPSKTVRPDSKHKLQARSPESRAARRFHELSSQERNTVAEILDTLDISLYSADSPAPATWATRFGDLQLVSSTNLPSST
jgi:hypothetical protein